MRQTEILMLIWGRSTKREDIMSDLWRGIDGVSFAVCETSGPVETFYQQHNPFGMSFLEQQDVILQTLIGFQENDAR